MKKPLLLPFIIVFIAFAHVAFAQPITVEGHSSNFQSGSSVTVSLPGGVQQGDFLLAHISCRPGSNFALKSDTTWVRLRSILAGGTNGVGSYFFYKIAGASEPSSYVFSDSAGSSSSDKLGIITVYRGVDTIAPIESEKGIAISSSPYSTPDDTTVTDSCMIVAMFGIRSTGTSSWTPPSGMTEEYDTSGAQSTRITSTGDYVLQPIAGSTGQKTATPSGGSGYVAAEIIALRPLSAVTSVSSSMSNSLFRIFPNPATNQLTVRGLRFTDASTFDIYNILGEKMLSASLSPGEGRGKTVDVSSLSNGIYFIRAQNENERHIAKFMKE